MNFGYFDDPRREYVITTPKTPYPWINYLGNNDFFSLISNTAGGYSFYKDALYRRLTRYRYNNVPTDSGGRYFYIKDGKTVWSPGWKPAKTDLDSYECRHGLGYSRIVSKKDGLKADVTFFVPLKEWAEVQRFVITNESEQTKAFSLYSFMEFCLWNAQDDMANFQRNFSTGEVEIKDSVIYHKTEYRERRNHYAFYSCSDKISGFDSDRETFIGLYNGFEAPQMVLEGRSGNSVADGWSPIASHRLDLELAAGESREIVFILGYIENPESSKWESSGVINKSPAETLMAKYSDGPKVSAALEELKAHWDDLLGRFSIETGDEKLNRMVNIWNQYQCVVTYNLSRSASYFESGIGRGIGFRDTNQDILGCMHQIPDKARQRILDVAATQMEDGGAYHQYQPLTKMGNHALGGNFMDDPLWLILSVAAYIKETGDFNLLDEKADFENRSELADTIFEHIKRSFHFVINNLGPHGLPLIGRADWNDCLNLNCFSTNPNESFQTCTNKDGNTAESLMIAGMFVYIGAEYVEICHRTGRAEEADFAQKQIAKMEKNIMAYGWDGKWYLRAWDDAGKKLGSHENDEGQIFIESQGWCSMAQVGLAQGMPAQALDSVKEQLDSKYGIVLHQPAFTKYHLHLGEISTYPEGYKENAGIFCHNNPWIMIAEALQENKERLWEYYKKICPAYLEEISEIHRTEPYVYAQMIAGKDAKRHGEAKNSWLTGTAAWNFVAVSQYILGVRPGWDGLEISPLLPPHVEEIKLTRQFRGRTYKINIDAKTSSNSQASKNGHEKPEIRVNGNLWAGPLPLGKKGDIFEVSVG